MDGPPRETKGVVVSHESPRTVEVRRRVLEVVPGDPGTLPVVIRGVHDPGPEVVPTATGTGGSLWTVEVTHARRVDGGPRVKVGLPTLRHNPLTDLGPIRREKSTRPTLPPTHVMVALV